MANPAIPIISETVWIGNGNDIDSKVNFTLVNTAAGTTAVSVKLIDKGVIQAISGDGGALLDRSSKQILKFYQPFWQ